MSLTNNPSQEAPTMAATEPANTLVKNNEIAQAVEVVEESTAKEEKVEPMVNEKSLTQGFVYMDNVKSILDVAMTTQKNVILFGPGGYGKSDFSLLYLEERGIDPYIITMGTGMTTDRLFGGLDIPTFNATGKIEYLTDNSFMNSDYVIFEELFDAPDFILEQLKDILSSGYFRNGTQIVELKTKLIICCTNKTREEFSKNNSLKALMERFPLETQVVWKDHTRINYEHLLNTKMGGCDPMLPYIFELYASAGIKISPRIAVAAAEISAQCGPDALTHIAELNKKPEILREAASKYKGIQELTELREKLQIIATDIVALTLNTLEEVKESKKLVTTLKAGIAKLKAIKADDSIVATVTDMIKVYTKVHDEANKKIEIVLNMEDDTETLDSGF